jgi:putative transposase
MLEKFIVARVNTIDDLWAGASPAPTLGHIIGAFKSLCFKRWLVYMRLHQIEEIGRFWQRNYYEHVLRNEAELYRTREYIIENPLKWKHDLENPLGDIDQEYLYKWD